MLLEYGYVVDNYVPERALPVTVPERNLNMFYEKDEQLTNG
jgi:hypothetical protein